MHIGPRLIRIFAKKSKIHKQLSSVTLNQNLITLFYNYYVYLREEYFVSLPVNMAKCNTNKSTLDNSTPPLLNLKLLLRPQGQIIDIKCKKSHKSVILIFFPDIIELVISNTHHIFGMDT